MSSPGGIHIRIMPKDCSVNALHTHIETEHACHQFLLMQFYLPSGRLEIKTRIPLKCTFRSNNCLNIINRILTKLDSGYLSWYSDGLWAARAWFDSRHCKIFLFSIAFRQALGLIQPPIRFSPGAASPGSSVRVVKLTIYLHLLRRSKMVEPSHHSPICLHDTVLY
jgi:hypothetical protein